MLLVLAFAAVEGGLAQGAEAELESIRLRIGELEDRLGRISGEARSYGAELERLDLEVELQERRLEEARVERAISGRRLAALVAEIDGLEGKLERNRRQLRRGTAALYRFGRSGVWKWLLTAPSVEDFFAGVRSLRYLAWRQARRIESYLADRGALDARREESRGESSRLTELESRERLRLGRLERLRARQRVIVAALEREQANLERKAEALERRERQLTELLELAAADAVAGGGERSIEDFKGVLDWPVQGDLIREFGPQTDPRYRTRVPHNGLTLATVLGSEVKAVFPGKVVYSADFEGFGLTVVLHHGDGVFTLYAGLYDLVVAGDDVVSSRQLLGRSSAETYFEVRAGNKAEDPLTWLR